MRIILDCEKVFQVPNFVRRHFSKNKEASSKMNGLSEFSEPPCSEVSYESKAIALFQRIDSMTAQLRYFQLVDLTFERR